MSLISDVPELALGRGYRYGLDVAPGASRSARVADSAEQVAGAVRLTTAAHPEVSNQVLLGGDLVVRPTYTDILFALNTPDDSTIVYDGLRYGFEWRDDAGTLLASGTYPPPNVRPVSSDQTRRSDVARVKHLPWRTYSLRLWTEDHGEAWETTWQIVTPRPAQPFASWTWVDTAWVPPSPEPTDPPSAGTYWRWDEPTLAWVEEPLP